MGEQMAVRRIDNNPSHTLTLFFCFCHEGNAVDQGYKAAVNTRIDAASKMVRTKDRFLWSAPLHYLSFILDFSLTVFHRGEYRYVRPQRMGLCPY
jgi:hypothetical protein